MIKISFKTNFNKYQNINSPSPVTHTHSHTPISSVIISSGTIIVNLPGKQFIYGHNRGKIYWNTHNIIFIGILSDIILWWMLLTATGKKKTVKRTICPKKIADSGLINNSLILVLVLSWLKIKFFTQPINRIFPWQTSPSNFFFFFAFCLLSMFA